jgi:hypothetical protein
MSTEMSVSNSTQQNCKEILTIMKNYGQDCRVIETLTSSSAAPVSPRAPFSRPYF